MAWTDADTVRERAPKRFLDADGWDNTAIEARIGDAETTLTAALVRIYGTELVTAWDSATPPLIEVLAADQAAVNCLVHAHGASQLEPGNPAANLQATIDGILADLGSGKRVLVDSSGAAIIPPDRYEDDRLATMDSTTRGQEPVFTTKRRATDSSISGSLDRF